MPVHFFYDSEGEWDPWSIRARKGSDTPSWEEYFWYTLYPGSWISTARSGEPEKVDYMATNVIMSMGTFAMAANAIAAAEAAGTTAIVAEFTLARAVTTVTVGVPVAFTVAVISAFTIAFARAQRDWNIYRRMMIASGADPGSMTQPLSDPTSPGIVY